MYDISSGRLRLCVSEKGAEAHGLLCDGAPEQGLLWDAGVAWDWHAPVCAPWCGRLRDGYFEEKGKQYENGIHGLLRDLPHTLVSQGEGVLSLKAEWRDTDRFPWPFDAVTTHTLRGNDWVTEVALTNVGTETMPVQMGFHTALRCPFAGGGPEDYQFRFEVEESPRRSLCEGGFSTGEAPPIYTGQSVIPVETTMFDDDSINLLGLKSRWVQLEGKATGRYLRLDIEGYDCVLLWSPAGIPGFLCIEPWNGLPEGVDSTHSLWERPFTRRLEPGETYMVVQRLGVGL